VSGDGATKHLGLKSFRIETLARWKSPRTGANYPMKWKVSLPGDDVELEITPAFAEQELVTQRSTRVTYWEGAVSVRGSFKKKPVAGQGYVEMTGYAGKLNI
jgi:predicted secreted hydrolase